MSVSKKLLINEPPLQVLPSLAKAIGLNEAIFVQQVHYWVMRSTNVANGYTWVYKTAEDWQKEFPFWSIKTIRRVATSCESWGVIKVGVFNKMKIDRTKWFRIDYEWLSQFEEHHEDNVATPCGQVGHMDVDNVTTTIPETTHENTTKIPPNPQGGKESKEVKFKYTTDFLEFWKAYPRKIGKGGAFNAWKRIKSRPAVEELILSVKAHERSEDWKRDGGQFIPHPQTWLNNRRWEDELDSSPTGNKTETPSF